MQLLGSSLTGGRIQCNARRSLARAPQPRGVLHTAPARPAPGARRRAVAVRAGGVPPELLGLAAFFAPGAAILAYAYYKGRGNLKDGLSRLLTDVRWAVGGGRASRCAGRRHMAVRGWLPCNHERRVERVRLGIAPVSKHTLSPSA
jgi:hypothetical protein